MAGKHSPLRRSVAGFAGFVLATSALGLTYNTTPSIPTGVYRIRPLNAHPARGEVVGFCLDREAAHLALARGYVHPAGLQLYRTRCRHGTGVLGKPVAGVPGDTVEARPDGVSINGRLLRRSQIATVDRSGRVLPAATGRRVLRAGEYWLQSEFTGRSYDSRIFGPVREEFILDRRVFMAGFPAFLLAALALAFFPPLAGACSSSTMRRAASSRAAASPSAPSAPLAGASAEPAGSAATWAWMCAKRTSASSRETPAATTSATRWSGREIVRVTPLAARPRPLHAGEPGTPAREAQAVLYVDRTPTADGGAVGRYAAMLTCMSPGPASTAVTLVLPNLSDTLPRPRRYRVQAPGVVPATDSLAQLAWAEALIPARDGITYRGMGGELVLREEPGGGLLGSYLVAFECAPEAPARGPERLVIGGGVRGAAQPSAAGGGASRRSAVRRLKALWPLGIALAVGLCVPLFRLHFFHTESAPIGLWRALPAARPGVGDVARFCMQADQARLATGRPYAGGRRGGPCPHDTWMLAKPVIAGPGDTIVQTPGAVLVNGRVLPLSATRTHDSRGLQVPAADYGTFVLGDGEFWMHSPYDDGSFDSRYLGVVRSEQLRGAMRPVLTWLTRSQRAALRARGLRATRRGLVACVQRER